jgi:hypothetical protein
VIPLTVIFLVVLSTDRDPPLQFRNATRQLHPWISELARASVIQRIDCHHIVRSFFKRWTLLTRQQQQILLTTPPTSCTTRIRKTRHRSLGKCVSSCVLPRFLRRNVIPLTVIFHCRFINKSGSATAISKCDKTVAPMDIGASKSISHTTDRLPPYSPVVLQKMGTVDTSRATDSADDSTDFMYDSNKENTPQVTW